MKNNLEMLWAFIQRAELYPHSEMKISKYERVKLARILRRLLAYHTDRPNELQSILNDTGERDE